MKTLEEIQQELIQEYKLNTKIIIEDIPDIVLTYFNRVAKSYAEQALDLAAEKVDLIEITHENNFALQDSRWVTNNMGETFAIDPQSIFKLKDQLK